MQLVKLGLITTISVFLAGCNNLAQLAESLLYANEVVNKKYVVPENPPAGFFEASFKFDSTLASGKTEVVDVRAWVYESPLPNAATLVYCHGNAENIGSLWSANFLNRLVGLGVNVVVIDYPSYGRSRGSKNEYNFVTGTVKAIQWSRKYFNHGPLIVWGRSFGASIALLATAQLNVGVVDKLILTSPWTRFIDVAKSQTDLAKQVPAEWLAQHAYDSLVYAPLIKIPVLIHHGAKDKTIPIKLGRTLNALLSVTTTTKFMELASRGHNDIFLENEVWNSVHEFFQD